MSNQQDIEQELLQSGALAFISKDKDAFTRLDEVLAESQSGEREEQV
jgi:hypothetical protein